MHGDIEKAREAFVSALIKYRSVRQHEITVVFDGYKNGPGAENAVTRGGVKIIYSGLGERADDVIKKIVSRERREWIVVSEDRDIVNHAWSVGSVPVPSGKFAEIILKYKNSEVPCAELSNSPDEEDFPRSQRGNPHKLSKKEKAVIRVLNKL